MLLHRSCQRPAANRRENAVITIPVLAPRAIHKIDHTYRNRSEGGSSSLSIEPHHSRLPADEERPRAFFSIKILKLYNILNIIII